jgi:hypothetical protein
MYSSLCSQRYPDPERTLQRRDLLEVSPLEQEVKC